MKGVERFGISKANKAVVIEKAIGSFFNAPMPGNTTNPLTNKGSEIMAKMKSTYGDKKGTKVFYASRNKGRIKGVD